MSNSLPIEAKLSANMMRHAALLLMDSGDRIYAASMMRQAQRLQESAGGKPLPELPNPLEKEAG